MKGLSLVELLVTMSVMVLLITMAAPSMAEFLRNARLREASNTVTIVLQQARGEAIKRNEPVTFRIDGSALTVSDSAGTVLRNEALPEGVVAAAQRVSDNAAASEIRFGGAGRTLPMGNAYRVDTSLPQVPCDEVAARCLRVMVRSGGSVRMCRSNQDC